MIRSNVSLMITEHSYITLQGKAKARQMGIDSDDKISGLKKLTDRIHKSDIKVFCQLNGGILENRLRFTLETIETVRNAVGND